MESKTAQTNSLGVNAVKSIVAQRDRDDGAESCQTRHKPAHAASPGTGWASHPAPKDAGEVMCSSGMLSPSPEPALVLPSHSALSAASSVPVLNARSCQQRQRGGFGTRDGGSRTQHTERNGGADPQKLTSCRKKNWCLFTRVLTRKIASYC